MTVTAKRDAPTAATMPMAMRLLADHMVTHQLPAAAEINVPGHLIGETTAPDVHIILDNPYVTRWIDSLDQITGTETTTHTGGTWYDTWGVANNIRVRLSHYVLRPPLRPLDDACDEATCDDADATVALPGITRWV